MFKTHRQKKLVIALAASLAIALGIGTGFAAWSISIPGSSSIEVSEDNDFTSALSFDTTQGINGMRSFAFDGESFLGTDGAPTTVATLTFYYVIDLDKVVEFHPGGVSSFLFESTISTKPELPSNTDFIMMDDSKFSITPTVSIVDGTGTAGSATDTSYGKTYYSFKCNITGIGYSQSYLRFSVAYRFSRKTLSWDFFNGIYKHIASNQGFFFVNQGSLSKI